MTNNSITAVKENLNELFNKWYKIPNYQRPYVWDVDNVIQLLDDLTEVMNTQNEYFLGSLVVKNSTESIGNINYTNYDLLDGQQRITTLFLLYSVVKGLTDDEDLKNDCFSKLYQKGNKFSSTPNRVRIEFDIRDNVNNFIDKYIIEKNIKDENVLEDLKKIADDKHNNYDISIKNMAENILVIYNYLLDNNIDYANLIMYINQYVSLIYVGSNNFDDAFKLFTVMNSRGTALRSSDILKAQNISVIPPEEQAKYAIQWEDTENYFDTYYDTFLSHIRTIIVKQRAKFSLLKEFEDNVYDKNLLSKGIQTFELIEKYKTIYEDLFEKSHFQEYGSLKFDNLLFYMKEGYEADYWITVIMKYFAKFRYKGLFEFVEKFDAKFSFDWITRVYATRRIDNVNEILRLIDANDNFQTILESDLLKIKEIDKILFKDIISSDIYGRRFARYLLLKLDYLLHSNETKMQKPYFLSIEHVLPRNPKENSVWVEEFSYEEREELTNKIGNLVLLSRRKNSSLSNRDYNEKKIKYFESNIEYFSRSNKLISTHDKWTPQTLINMQEESVRLLLEKY